MMTGFGSVKLAIGALAIAVGLYAPQSQAATVTHGFLTSDNTTNIITDSANNRQYTRLNAFNMTVAQTLTAVGVGGAWEGWSIMTSTQIDQFVAAMLGTASSSCAGSVPNGTDCGVVSGWADADFGASHNSTTDFIGFFNTGPGPRPIGVLKILSSGLTSEFESWGAHSKLDAYGDATRAAIPINLMLFKDTLPPVPLPASGLLLLTVLGGLGVARKRRKVA